MIKYPHLGGALALLALLTLASAPVHAGSGKDTLKLMPHDTTMVLSIDIKSLSRSKLARKTFKTLSQGGDVATAKTKLLEDAGVDIEKDVDLMVIGIAGDLDNSDRMVLVVEGRFDEAKMTKFFKAESKSFVRQKHSGGAYYLVDDENEFAFLGKYFVATPKGSMSGVLDRHLGTGKSARQNRALARLLKNSQTKKQLWMGLVLTPAMRKEIASEAAGHTMNTAIVGIAMTKNLDVSMRMGVSDAKAASAMAAALRAQVAELAKEPSMSLVGLADTFKNMTIKSNGSNVDVDATVSEASVQQILGIAQSMI